MYKLRASLTTYVVQMFRMLVGSVHEEKATEREESWELFAVELLRRFEVYWRVTCAMKKYMHAKRELDTLRKTMQVLSPLSLHARGAFASPPHARARVLHPAPVDELPR